VVIDDLYVVRITRTPSKANTPLIVDPDTVLTGSVAFQRLKPIARRDAQEIQGGRSMDLQQLPVRNPLYVRRKAPAILTLKEPFGVLVRETFDHRSIAPTITE
jgi:hypothetical protein